MSRSIGFAYSIAGAAVAALVIVVAGTTVGLPGSADAAEDESTQAQFQATQDAPVSLPWPGMDAGNTGAPIDGQEVLPASGEQVEYVYVDEPSGRGYDDDDHDDDDDHEDEDDHDEDDHDEDDDDDRRERREHDDDDEDHD